MSRSMEVPLPLRQAGWRLEEPPPPAIDKISSCGKDRAPSCALECMRKAKVPRNARARRGTPGLNSTSICERCECALCAICSKPANRWTAPSGQTIETVTTRTEPRFTFAYNPHDDDMRRMRKTMILEPSLTHAWHEATWECCNQSGGVVVDVGGNFGWYTLYSLALGCSVIVFEPVPAYQEVLRLGLSLNPGFASRTTLYGNVVYDTPGNYTLRVPVARAGGRMKKLGMTGMKGSAGILKADWKAASYEHTATSVRLDEILKGRNQGGPPVCMFKADVEGYEPQVLQTARRLLSQSRIPNLQLELTKTPGSKNQTCAAIGMLAQLTQLGYEFKQVTNKIVDLPAPPVGSWRSSPGPWATLPSMPSPRALGSVSLASRAGALFNRGRSGFPDHLTPDAARQLWGNALRIDFTSFSTNLVARLRQGKPACGEGARACPEWPSLAC